MSQIYFFFKKVNHKFVFYCSLQANRHTMIIVIGDSNYREICGTLKDKIESEVGEKLTFRQATNNESLKIALDEEEVNGDKPKVILVGANLNEIALRAKGNKGRDEVVKTVVMEQNCAVNKWAEDHQETLILLLPPFLRKDPVWMEDRLKWVHFCMTDDIKIYSPFNVQFASAANIVDADLKPDKVHLLASGMSKVADTMIADILVGLRDVEKLRAERMETETEDIILESSQLANLPSQTPVRSTNKKRPRVEENVEVNLQQEKKNRCDSNNSSAMMDRMEFLIKSIEEERKRTLEKVKGLEENQGKIIKNQKETEVKVDHLTKVVESDSILFATMKEDIDAGENEMLKDTVIVKRMKANLEIPKDKKALAKYVQTEGRKLVKEIIGVDDDVKFVTTLYNNNNTNNSKGSKRGQKEKDDGPTIPPFKIVFKSKERGINFREKAVAKAKEEDSNMGKIYFSHMHNNSTRIRTMLMWGVVDALKKEKKESWVNLNLNKPNIQIKEGGKITKTLTFAGAMSEYGERIDPKVITETTKAAMWNFGGKLERLFIILKD